MANDVADYTSSVVIQSGSVTIAGTATVQITGTPTVNIGNTPTVVIGAGTAAIGSVSIGNTPTVVIGAGTAAIGSVSISAGSVTIANASIGVINAAGTKITSARPPKRLITPNVVASGTVTVKTPVLDSDIQAIVFVLDTALNTFAHIKAVYSGAPITTTPWVPAELFTFPQAVYVYPVLPAVTDGNLNLVQTLDVTLTASAAGVAILEVWALYESAPEWLTVFPQPQLAPNQFPLFSIPSLVNGVAQWLIAPVANVQITIFSIFLFWANADTTRPLYVGHNLTLPGAGLTPNPIFAQLTPGPPGWDLHKAQLPRGEGLYIEQLNGATLAAAVTIIYSLS